MKSLLSSYSRVGILSFILLAAAAATSINALINGNIVLALSRGTVFDDVLISVMGNESNSKGTDQMAVIEAETVIGTNQNQNATSEFIYGDYGNDEIQGSSISDHLSGGPGSDVIYGNDGGDYIQGGPGIDSLYGGAGDDVLSGGEGADYFDCGPGRDSIDDFNSTEGDYALNNCEVLENKERPSQ